MQYSSVTNLQWLNVEQSAFDCIVEFEGLGEVPFSTAADDTTPHGAEIWSRALDGDFGEIAAYVLPGPPTVADRQQTMLSRIEAKRFEVETGGITVSGVPIRTDRETAAIITAARVLAAENENFTIPNWKAAPGLFVSLDAPTIIAIADAVRGHVQACFDKEAALTIQIMAAESHGDLDAIDVDAGWPGN